MIEKVEHSYAGFGVRFVAAFIDGFLLAVITWPILHFTYGESYWENDSPLIMGNIDFLLSWLLPIFGTIVFWLYRAGTPGKLMNNLAVIDATTGNNLTLSQCLIRYLGYILSAIPFFLGYIWIALDDKNQGWHDKLAKSIVIKKTETTHQSKSQLNA